jgi:hypothetical protein
MRCFASLRRKTSGTSIGSIAVAIAPEPRAADITAIGLRHGTNEQSGRMTILFPRMGSIMECWNQASRHELLDRTLIFEDTAAVGDRDGAGGEVLGHEAEVNLGDVLRVGYPANQRPGPELLEHRLRDAVP